MLWARVMRGMSSIANSVTPRSASCLHGARIAERIARRDDHEAFAHRVEVGGAGVRIRAEAADLQHDVGRLKELAAIERDFCAGLAIGVIGEAGRACRRRLRSARVRRPSRAARTLAGTRATRRSPGKVSLGTEMIM